MFGIARHNRSAPVATARDHNGNPQNPRSASTSIPGSSRSMTSRASVFSAVVYGPTAASKTAWVPHSATATTRAWGNAACSPLFTPGRPNHRAFSAVSATSRQVPSIATSRRPASHAPAAPGVASGRATRANNASTGSDPSRARAWKIADFDGNLTGSAPDVHANPSVNNPSTSS